MGGMSVVLEAEQEKAVWINFWVCICFCLSEDVLDVLVLAIGTWSNQVQLPLFQRWIAVKLS